MLGRGRNYVQLWKLQNLLQGRSFEIDNLPWWRCMEYHTMLPKRNSTQRKDNREYIAEKRWWRRMANTQLEIGENHLSQRWNYQKKDKIGHDATAKVPRSAESELPYYWRKYDRSWLLRPQWGRPWNRVEARLLLYLIIAMHCLANCKVDDGFWLLLSYY